VEAVGVALPTRGWVEEVLADLGRFAAVAVGPGLGRAPDTVEGVRRLLAASDRPLVLDGDGLWALGGPDEATSMLLTRPGPTVLTPHDGELARLTGAPPGEDRVDAARSLARDTGCTVLVKGPTTVVADPHGSALLVRSGDQRLATAGTGDVLTGLVAAHLTLGVPPLRAAAAAAHLHGVAAAIGAPRGVVASDVARAVPAAWSALLDGRAVTAASAVARS
jgi:NAD(P)H-hydrate epimerase